MTRKMQLQNVVDRLTEAFAVAEVTPPARAALDRVFGRLAGSTGAANGADNDGSVALSGIAPQGAAAPRTTTEGEALPVTRLLPVALAPLLTRADALGALADALATLAPDLAWTTRKSVGPTASAGFPQAHANAMLVGPAGLEPRDDVWIGLSLMEPHTRYPDHDHAPEEVYLTLSPGGFLQGEAEWLARQPGDTVYNTPGIRHAMRAGDQPFLALWCLPI